jgi:hypothetical protein
LHTVTNVGYKLTPFGGWFLNKWGNRVIRE